MAEAQTNVVLEAAKNLAQGIPPTNTQIEESLDIAKNVIETQQGGGLDARTDLIAQDLKAVINDTQRLLEEKNRDEKMQRFLLEAKLAAEEMARTIEEDGDDIKKDLKDAGKQVRPLQDEALEILQMVKSVLYQVMRSNDFRKSLVNGIELFQQVFWDQVQDKGKQLTDNLKQDIEKGDSSMSNTKEAAKDVADRSRQEAKQGDLNSLSGEQKKQELKRRFNTLLREIGENTEYNQAVTDLFKLTGKLRARLDKAAKKAKGAAKNVENAHVARMWEIGQQIIEEFVGHNRIHDIIAALTDLLDAIRENEHANKFFEDLRKYVVEGLEHPEKLQIDTTTTTTNVSAGYGSTSVTASVSATTPASGSAPAKDAYDELYEEGRKVFEDKELQKKANKLIDEVRDMVRTARRDPASERLAESTRALMHDLVVDPSTGKPSLWTLRDNIERSGRSILLPVLLRELEIVPVKGIRGRTKTYDYAIRNLAFSAYDLLPERARFYMDLDVDLDLSDIKRDAVRAAEDAEKIPLRPELDFAKGHEADVNGEVVLRLDKIKTHVRDVEFHYLRKTFPEIEDWGRMDVDTVENGCRLEVRWRIVSPRGGASPTVVGYKVACHIDGLNVTIKHAAKHEYLDKMMAKLFAGQLKERIERELERNLGAFAGRVSLLFNDVFAGRMPSILPKSMTAALPVLSM